MTPPLIKNFVLILSFFFAANSSAFADGAYPRTKEAWIAIIKKDAKLSSLETLLGRPDEKKSFQDLDGPRVREDWYGKLDTGTAHPDNLRVMASPYNGELIIWSVWDPVAREAYVFPWAEKARGVAGH